MQLIIFSQVSRTFEETNEKSSEVTSQSCLFPFDISIVYSHHLISFSQAWSMISKLTEEKTSATQQSQKLRLELVSVYPSDLLVICLIFINELHILCIQEMLRKESSKKQSGGHSLVLMLLVGLLGCVIGYILNRM